ncbi:MAG: cobalamin biosynthesis protein CbiX [Rhodoferax sp.]|nr:cobalamin biosynthesis protein CbiX [Rhodoferax sp.]OIP24435.1 MAG: hypothetical protein AUK52_02375 [Comamonadaceae bacterium CG2_30_60_41]PIW07086.1 MAG: cobalamin biosynthesis protein CbiX [Comamonadaceae bacterium CG17_big_fil_post_rev_8_21_14_2_50_60_13]PIY25402.1 MAG: cobalamin biosynthesis protein CbiX [Comamonadaceae bacterium CG_4_10_14_3_um_filter_60_75]PJC12099.1 MAG: cobalamin biosynthesis protein CbiX [Comamonadaceae bacterium CG_4_9_14_0_8_um_filter_60_18]
MRATLFFAHGSRDAAWRGCVDKIVQQAIELDPKALVGCAFLELMQPDLNCAVARMHALGATEIIIVPLFLGLGKHAREDTPKLVAQLACAHPDLRLVLKRSVGEEPEVIDLLAKMALFNP